MPVMNSVVDLQNETARQQALDYAREVQNSVENGRNVGGNMGKNDFLMLLAAQLRYQNPLEPQNDSDFAAQLAQFTSLEQMQNMNTSMNTMNNYQAYGLVGKFVMAEAFLDGEFMMFSGVVDSVFTKSGVLHAQIGEYVVPVTAITEVFDTNNILTTEMFMTTSSHLIGRTVVADLGGGIEIEGTVTRILVDKGSLLAQVDDGSGDPKFVPVNTIVDIREPGSIKHTPKPDTPPEGIYFKKDPDSDGFFELDPDNLDIIIGRWDWDNEAWEWVYTDLTALGGGEEPEDPIDGPGSGEDGEIIEDPIDDQNETDTGDQEDKQAA